MRFSLIAVLILAFAAVAHSQIPGAVSSEPNPNLQVVNAKWQIYSPPVDNSIDFWHTNPFRYSGHAPLNFAAKLLVKNTSAKTITGFDLDYLFLDASGSEFLRYRFHESVDIKPGQDKQLTQKIQQTGRHRERYTPIKPDDAQLLKTRYCPTRVIVRRIEYAGGSAWERP
ncbi:MAG TPA: hypothetical protein VK557_10865 [Pyrinomonadaceae bacterium]|nr:hypothetical protein [Pyrinomonadaceae bacterium]